jgi:hypothetical protein
VKYFNVFYIIYVNYEYIISVPAACPYRKICTENSATISAVIYSVIPVPVMDGSLDGEG